MGITTTLSAAEEGGGQSPIQKAIVSAEIIPIVRFFKIICFIWHFPFYEFLYFYDFHTA
jgi:hypothetical protein